MNESYKKYFSAKEIDELETLNERPVLVQAMKKLVLKSVMYDGVLQPDEPTDPNRNFLLELAGSGYTRDGMINNEALGQNLRAKVEGLRWVEIGFKDLESFKKEKVVKKDNKNPGR